MQLFPTVFHRFLLDLVQSVVEWTVTVVECNLAFAGKGMIVVGWTFSLIGRAMTAVEYSLTFAGRKMMFVDQAL